MKKIQRILILCLALLFFCMPTVSALSNDTGGEYIRYETLSSSQLLALLTDSAVSDTEAAYLDRYGDAEIRYNSALPGELITLGEWGATAEVYVTATRDGREIVWTPAGDVMLNDTEGTAEALYEGALTVGLEEANRLLNFAYEEALLADAAEKEIAAYEAELARYEAYPKLLAQYQQDLLAYNAYVAAKEQYALDVAAYEKNQKAWADYAEASAAYEDYKTARAQYLKDRQNYATKKDEYDKATGEYVEYVKNQQRIAAVMLPMESMFINYGHLDGSVYGLSENLTVSSLYKALQNEDLVAMLLKYQDALCAGTNLTKAEFESLKLCSDELNALLRQYAEKRELSEKDAFLFYQQNYTEIRDKFNHLYDEMTRILKPSVYSLLCAYVDSEYGSMASYKKWRMKNVLCQIYLVSQCLDDTSTATTQWSFYADDGDPTDYPYSHLLNQQQTVTDLNQSDPSAVSWRDEPVVPAEPTLPVEPTPVAKPTAPLEILTEPTPPPAVEEPKEPTPVDKPIAPTQETYARVTRCAGLLELWRKGELTLRRELTEDGTVTLTERVLRRYDPATGQALPSVYNERGELCLKEEVASEWEDEGTKYILLGFRESEDGLCFYPVYETEDRIFTVTFCSEGQVLFQKDYGYGQMPEPVDETGAPLIPTKEATGAYAYEFSSWEPALYPVKEDVTYEACFTARERQYAVTYRMPETEVIQYHTWQSVPTPPTPTEQYREGIRLYRWIGWDAEPAPVTGNAVYTAMYETVLLAEKPEGEKGAPTLTQDQTGYTVTTDGTALRIEAMLDYCEAQQKSLTLVFADGQSRLELSRAAIASLREQGAEWVELFDAAEDRGTGIAFRNTEGDRVFPKGTVRLSLPADPSEGRFCVRRYGSDGTYEDLDEEAVNGSFLVDVEGDSTYRIIRKYTLTVRVEGNGTVTPQTLLLEEGAPITLSVYPAWGYRMGRCLLTAASTKEGRTLESLEGLTMPAYDAVLTVSFEEILYTVEFRYHGGTEIRTYRFGEEVTPPTIPLSFTENGSFYSFIGWSKNVETATEDTVYEAKYEIVPEGSVGNGEGGAWWGVLRYWILPALGILLGIAILITAGILIPKKLWKKRKNGTK